MIIDGILYANCTNHAILLSDSLPNSFIIPASYAIISFAAPNPPYKASDPLPAITH